MQRVLLYGSALMFTILTMNKITAMQFIIHIIIISCAPATLWHTHTPFIHIRNFRERIADKNIHSVLSLAVFSYRNGVLTNNIYIKCVFVCLSLCLRAREHSNLKFSPHENKRVPIFRDRNNNIREFRVKHKS